MIQPLDTFRISSKEIAAKILDGEAIIINLTTGTYYSTDGVGAFVWGLVEAGHTVGAIVPKLKSRFAIPAETDVEADLRTFLGRLLEESLIAAGPPNDAVAPLPEDEQPAAAYSPPVLNAYRDMDDMLALDPPVPGLEPIPWTDPESSR